MHVQIRRTKGDQFTPDDVIEVKLTDSADVDTFTYANWESVLHTVNSNTNVTHGGGVAVGEYVHCGTAEATDLNGDIDYSTVLLIVRQENQAEDDITVTVKGITKEKATEYETDHATWEADKLDAEEAGESFTTAEPLKIDYYEEATSGTLTLQYGTESFV